MMFFRVTIVFSASLPAHQAESWDPTLPLAVGFSPIDVHTANLRWENAGLGCAEDGFVLCAASPLSSCLAAIRHDERAAGLCLPGGSFISIKESNFQRYIFIHKPSIFQGYGKAPNGGGELPQSQRLFS